MGILRLIVAFVRAFFVSRAALAAENIALRHQLAVLQRAVQRPQLRKRDMRGRRSHEHLLPFDAPFRRMLPPWATVS